MRRFRLRDNSESPNLRALAYNEDRCLWITVASSIEGSAQATLESVGAENLVDQWRERTDEADLNLPNYVRLHDSPCRTLVALPLRHHGDKLGV